MNKKIFSFVALAICVAAGIYFRYYALSLPVLNLIASQDIRREESKAVEAAVKENYSNISIIVKNKLIERFMRDKFSGKDADIEARTHRRAQELREKFSDEQGHVYLNGVDSYHWLRLLRNLLDKGHVGDRVVDGAAYDDLIAVPMESSSDKNIHVWLGFLFYKAVLLFNPAAPLRSVLFYVPIFLSVIIGIFTFFVSRRLGADELGAFFASVAVNLSPFLLERSVTEWFDTDIYNVLFPLLVFGVFVFCFKSKNILRRMILVCLSAFFLACYAATWKGWWFVFDIMLISYLLFILNLKLAFSEKLEGVQDDQQLLSRQRRAIKGHYVLLSAFFFISGLFIICINGFNTWKDFIIEPLHLSNILNVTPEAMWPNVYQTVAELRNIQTFELMTMLGGTFVFFMAMAGLLYLFLIKRHSRDEDYGFGILTVILWTVAIFFATLQAFRFALLLVVPVGLAFGLSFTAFYKFVDEKVSGRGRVWLALSARFLVVAVFCVYLFFNTSTIHAKLLPVTPQMTDAWYNVLSKIKTDTPQDAIIDSWWDFGHWFKTLCSRRVLFDGMTQNTPYAYWMASVLLTDKEEQALGILRMINANDNKVVDLLERQEDIDLVRAIAIAKGACAKTNAQEASLFLKENSVDDGIIREVSALLFTDHLPPVYLIISYDMIAKIGAISYIGNWDFQKVDMWFKRRELKKDDFSTYLVRHYGLDFSQAQNLESEISLLDDDESKAWFSKTLYHISPLSKEDKKDGRLLFFNNGLVVDLENHHAFVMSEFEEKRGTPESLFYMQDDRFIEIAQENPDKTFSALLIQNGDSSQSMLVDSSFARSMLARLYFFKGRGLKSFELFAESQDEDGNAIYCYRIRWPNEKTGHLK